MQTNEVDPEVVYFCVGVPDGKQQIPTLYSRPRHENIGRSRKDPWFFCGNWIVVSDEDLVRIYGNRISHDGLPR